MAENPTSIAYVRNSFVAPEPPPESQSNVLGWVRANLFATPKDAVLTIIAVLALVYYLPQAIDFLFISAVWTGADRSVCTTAVQGGIQPDGWSGACWAYVGDRFVQFMFGSYPRDQLWRPLAVLVVAVALLIPFMMPKAPRKGLNALLLLVAMPILAYILLLGGWFGLPYVETARWGGLMVTLILSFIGITVSLPLGILLALGRRSELPVVKTACIVFIELIRGVPLITVLFMASVLLPLFLPPGSSIDKFLRALVGVSIFAAAYMAEVIRGGLQAIPKGQYEAAAAMGLGYWRTTGLVILPQALKLTIPGLVNTIIALFKDTSLVIIIGLFDLFSSVQQATVDPAWLGMSTEGYVFAALVYWIFCFSMSRYSQYLEKRFHTGRKAH